MSEKIANTCVRNCVRVRTQFDIEPHLLDSENDQSGFVKHVIKTGQIIYQA